MSHPRFFSPSLGPALSRRDTARMPRQNLEAILGFPFPAPPTPLDGEGNGGGKGEGWEAAYVEECCICYAYRLGDGSSKERGGTTWEGRGAKERESKGRTSRAGWHPQVFLALSFSPVPIFSLRYPHRYLRERALPPALPLCLPSPVASDAPRREDDS